MSFQVTTAFVQQYKDAVALLLQQRGSKLRGAVTEGTYVGKGAKFVEQIGAVTAQKVMTRHSDTPLISTPHDARWVYPVDYRWADLIDDTDRLRMLIDPTSAYVINGGYSLGRALDDEIITAFFGTAKTGENGTTDTAFDTSNQRIAVGFASAGNQLTLEKLREARRILVANEVDVDFDPLYMALGSQQQDDLLALTQTTSLDYNTKPTLVEGKVTAFMGFNFIGIERLPVNGSGYRRVPAWAKSGMHVGIWNDIGASVDKRPDKNNSMQVLVNGTFGGSRTEEGKVIEILCDES